MSSLFDMLRVASQQASSMLIAKMCSLIQIFAAAIFFANLLCLALTVCLNLARSQSFLTLESAADEIQWGNKLDIEDKSCLLVF